MTLVPTYSYLRLSVTDRCDFNCFYCRPSERRDFLSPEAFLSHAEIRRLVGFFVNRGVRHVRITGGEPLVRTDFSELLDAVASVPGIERLSITTNGYKLAGHLSVLRGRVQGVNVSLDTLRRDRFAKLTGRDVLPQVKNAVLAAAQECGLQVKLNVILIRGFNDDEIPDFIEFAGRYGVDVRFIEYFATSSRSPIFNSHVVTSAEARASISAHFGPLTCLGRDQLAGPAEYYRLAHAAFRIGFISAVTEFFCSACNRLRLTADGRLYPCLHAEMNADLGGPLRVGDIAEMERRLGMVLDTKTSYNKVNCSRTFDMSAIGG